MVRTTPRPGFTTSEPSARGASATPAFAVGALPEGTETEPDSDDRDAQRVEVGAVANEVIGDKTDVDYYTFAGKAGRSSTAPRPRSTAD